MQTTATKAGELAMDNLERQYLLTAHDLAMADPRRTFFYEDEVDDRMELDYGPNSDEDLIANRMTAPS
jgi:hypothetical protein